MPKQYEIHPAANIFPMMNDEEFKGLKQDIEMHGLRSFITVWKDQIIDGRNREKACRELGIEPTYEELDESIDPFEYVISHNLHRRHLNQSQRSIVAAKMATLKHGGDRRSESIKVQNCTLNSTVDEAASMLNVSPRSVKSARKVVDNGSKELVAAVEQGQISVALAEKLVTEETDKKTQSSLVRKGKDAVREHLTSHDYVDAEEDREEEVAQGDLASFKKTWKKASKLGRKYIREWLDQHYLDG